MKPENRSLTHRILRAGVVVGFAHLLFKLAGLIQTVVMSRYLEGSVYDVVYAFAFESCIFTIFLCFEEVIGPAFLPVFMQTLKEDGEKRAGAFAGKFLTLQLLLLAAICLLLAAFPNLVVRLLTQWSPDNKPDNYLLAIRSVRMLSPALLGLALGSTTYVMLNGHKRFFLAAFGDAVWKFVVVAALLGWALTRGTQDIARALIAGLVIGSVCKVATHLWGLRDKLRNLKPSFRFNDPLMRRVLWLALPLVAGIVFAKARDVVNQSYVLSQLPEDGLLQANSMGRKLYSTLHWLVPYTLSIAVFPFFCDLADKRDVQGLARFVTKYGRMMLALFFPLCAIVAVVAVPLTALVFKSKLFGAESIGWTAVSMACYTFVMPAAALEAVLMQAFFAHRRVFSVTAAGIAFSALSIALSFLGLRLFPGSPALILAAIAGGFALSRTLKTITLSWMLRRNAPVFPLGETAWFILRLALCTCATAAAAWAGLLIARTLPVSDILPERIINALLVCAGGAAGVIGTAAAFLLLRIDEPRELILWLLAKVRRGNA